MKMPLPVDIPPEPFNGLVRAGTRGDTLNSIVDHLKTPAAYSTEHDGRRGVMLLIEVDNPSDVPRFAEPFVLKFNADCRFRIGMSPDDVGKAGLGELGQQWA